VNFHATARVEDAPRPGERQVVPDNAAKLEAFGKALLKFAQTGNRAALDRSVISLADVASGIIAIARGRDARVVFGQAVKRGRQSQQSFNFAIAWTYWRERAENPADIDAAVKAAQAHFPYRRPPSRPAIQRIARTYRDRVLELLPVQGDYKDDDGKHHVVPSGIDIEPLLAFLEKRSKARDW